MERPIRYLRQSFLYGREFVSDGDLEQQCVAWLADVANARVHQTTKEVPTARFERDERALLQPLAPRAYQSLVLAQPAAPQSSQSSSPQSSSPQSSARALALPKVDVEQRSLAAYARLAAHLAGAAR